MSEAVSAWEILGLRLPMSGLPESPEQYVRVQVGGQVNDGLRLLPAGALRPATYTIQRDADTPGAERRLDVLTDAMCCMQTGGLPADYLGNAATCAGLGERGGSQLRDAILELIAGALNRGATNIVTAAQLPVLGSVAPQGELVWAMWENGAPRDVNAFVQTAKYAYAPPDEQIGSPTPDNDEGLEAHIVSKLTLAALGGTILSAYKNQVAIISLLTPEPGLGRITHSTTYRTIGIMGNVTALTLPFGVRS